MSDGSTVIRPTDTPGVWNFILGGSKLASTSEICASEKTLKEYIKAKIGNRDDIQITQFLWTSPYRYVTSFPHFSRLITYDKNLELIYEW